ncbi:MAG: 3-oxoacyl-ACP reductase FabG [Betaproteobacteria bacterium]|nr:3-oxoacyl-ACP reductase FabG [Betaproteobacteria bacterium]
MSDTPDTAAQVALVTGASRGIGEAILHSLALAGMRVIGTATSDAGAQHITVTLAAAGLGGRGARLDVRDASAIDTLLADIEANEGTLTVLVNNAGINRDNLLMRMKDEEWDDIVATNLSAVFRLCKAVIRPMMKARYGRIVNITSVVGHAGNAGQTNYAAAKAGVAGFTRSLAREVGSRGITANCVAPGFIDTDMTRALSETQREALLGGIPAGRLGHVDDVAAAVTFLASPSAAYITGETLHVNGGMLMA